MPLKAGKSKKQLVTILGTATGSLDNLELELSYKQSI